MVYDSLPNTWLLRSGRYAPGIPAQKMSLAQYDTFDEWTWAHFGLSIGAVFRRMYDHLRVLPKSELARLHRQLRKRIQDSAKWPGYDYGHGYFYQGFDLLSLSGRRSTAARLKELDIGDLVRGKKCLDIGCNAGMISLSIARSAAEVVGLELNPHLIDIANLCQGYLALTNCRFLHSSFAEFDGADESFDVVLSLSNHVTYDGPLSATLNEYVGKCASLLAPGGHIVFEFHTPKFEQRFGFAETGVGILEQRFKRLSLSSPLLGNSLDRGRCVFVGELK